MRKLAEAQQQVLVDSLVALGLGTKRADAEDMLRSTGGDVQAAAAQILASKEGDQLNEIEKEAEEAEKALQLAKEREMVTRMDSTSVKPGEVRSRAW